VGKAKRTAAAKAVHVVTAQGLSPFGPAPTELCWCGCGYHWHRNIPGLRKRTPEQQAAWLAAGGRYSREPYTPAGYGSPSRYSGPAVKASILDWADDE
jgi:hypothetical protein